MMRREGLTNQQTYEQLFNERLAELDPGVAAQMGRIVTERFVSRQTVLDIITLMDVQHTLDSEPQQLELGQ